MDNQTVLFEAVKRFIPGGEPKSAVRIGEGHINNTYLVSFSNGYDGIILQKVNTSIFTEPVKLMENIVNVTEFCRKKIQKAGGDPNRETLNVIGTVDGNSYYIDSQGGFYRCFALIQDAIGYEKIENANQMYSSGQAFGHFQKMLSDFPAQSLFETIPNFHNTPKRFAAFKEALSADTFGRAESAKKEIEFLLKREREFGRIQMLLDSGAMPVRVTHNDTKLNNVLIDNQTGKAICVVDLDTVMPGSALYDYGDSIRSGANAAAEDEIDLSLVYLNNEYFEEYTKGYLSEAKEFLTKIELDNLAFSARLIAYELGMRFLTDFLNGDTYFKPHHQGHNYERARTQLYLAEVMENNSEYMEKTVRLYSV